ncbi:unnamed protein product [Rotaria sp. Silwood1]|nr:unnamed protein product [Rotaria sp. Silwood1]CAF3367133.1 unnamed protein product [Rotaria sp. Silwood1]CAF3369028.1 unnamed protein product [Rotaria sp. Silwood1]CAF4554964.1 unnamed protein product [Rotaria sp. Silwood1]CAF4813860.1 unnamed protein product [Rotaria sp. Silwood1]
MSMKIEYNPYRINLLFYIEKSIVNDETKPILNVYNNNNQEKWYIVARQLVLPFMISGFGMVAAGLLLERTKELKVFQEITEIYILVPALLDLKGNLEMTLASRLSTQANIGNIDKICKFKDLFIGNVILIQLQAIVIGFLAALVSILISWLSQGHFNIRYALILCSSSVSTATIASTVLGVVMIIVIVLSHKCKINPDNIATPVAASLGDLTTVVVLAGVSQFLFQITNFRSLLLMIIIVFFLTLIPIWTMICARNEHVKDVLIHGWSPIIAAMFISSTGGLILAFAVQTLHGIIAFQPVMNGVCGNLVTVQASRLSTALHQQGKPGEFQNDEQHTASTDCPNPYKLFCSRANASCIVRLLLFMAIPGHLTFLFIIWQLAANHIQISFLFISLYLIAALIQVAVLLYIAQWIVSFVWRHRRDPDNVCIPYLTSTGDLLGTALLTCVFLLLA